MYTAKVPTTPDEQSRGVMEAVRAVLEQAGAQPGQVERFAHGMTVATNALLEGKAARTALIATEGFADIVELGRQGRAHLYRLCAAAPAPLAPVNLRFEAPERMTPNGPLRALDPRAAEELVEQIVLADPESVAVALLHSYAHPEHERLLGRAARRAPAERARVALARAGGHLPRVRARRHHRGRRRPLPPARRLLAPPRRASRSARVDPAGNHAVLGRPHRCRGSRSARGADGALRPRRWGGRRGGAGGAGGAGGRARRAVLRHGRYLLRRMPDRWRPRGGDGGGRRGGQAARAGDARHPHRGRRRRLDRVARPRRRAARGPALRGRRPRAGVLRARR